MKPSPILSHMPWNVMNQIIVSSDTRSRLSLRKCSKQMRNIVDNTALHYRYFEVSIDAGVISLEILAYLKQKPSTECQLRIIQYHFHPEGHVIRDGDWEKLVEGHDHISAAVSDLATLVKNPNIHVDGLGFRVQDRNPEYNVDQRILDEAVLRTNMMKLFNSLGHQLSPRGIRIELPLDLNQVMLILSRIKPETIYLLSVKLHPGIKELDRLTESEHWKHAKQLGLKADYYPIHKMGHFLYISLKQPKLSVGDVKMIVEMALKHGENYQIAYLTDSKYENYSEVSEYLSQYRSFDMYGTTFYLIDIPNSKESLRVHITDRSIHIHVH